LSEKRGKGVFIGTREERGGKRSKKSTSLSRKELKLPLGKREKRRQKAAKKVGWEKQQRSTCQAVRGVSKGEENGGERK